MFLGNCFCYRFLPVFGRYYVGNEAKTMFRALHQTIRLKRATMQTLLVVPICFMTPTDLALFRQAS